MKILQTEIRLPPMPRGLHLIDEYVARAIGDWAMNDGILHLFLRHTSAGLTVNENYDPTVRTDLEAFLDRLVPEDQPYFEHTLEGPDDMPAHVKAALTGHSVQLPVHNGKIRTGTWQGIYLCEFRNRGGGRKIFVTYCGT